MMPIKMKMIVLFKPIKFFLALTLLLSTTFTTQMSLVQGYTPRPANNKLAGARLAFTQHKATTLVPPASFVDATTLVTPPRTPSPTPSLVDETAECEVVAPPSLPQITWEFEAKDLIEKLLLHKQQEAESDRPLMVAIVGIPGSGKSTSTEIIAGLLGPHCLAMPFDGYHYSMAQLRACQNAQDLIWRRGAPDTFDAARLQRDLHRIRYGSNDKEEDARIYLPGFCHGAGDPTPNQHCFDRRQHNIVLTEGLYLLHDDDGWSNIKNCFDLTIFVDASVDTCMDRLKVRNQAIPGYTADEVMYRVDAVDRVNAEIVARSKARAHWVVQSAAALK